MDEFLRGLAMRVRYGPITPVDLARATQLLNKTNQFNMTTRRYASDEVAQLATACENLALQFRLSDRLGDSGLVSVFLARPVAGDNEALEIENWVMSCRVFGRQLEVEVMNTVVAAARARGVRMLYGVYIPTERNAVVSGLYESLGFSRSDAQDSPTGAIRWQLSVADYVATPTFIDREEPMT
jgi:FkbH-like protein